MLRARRDSWNSARGWENWALTGRHAQWMSGLCLFFTHLAQSVRPATIKVYLSAVRALQIEQGFPDPLVNCVQLQRVRAIK